MIEFGKRLDGPGGRRRAPRQPVLLSAAMLTTGCSRPVTLLDISRTGARLRVTMRMRLGQEVWLKLLATAIFGKVRWIGPDCCGLVFDQPLTEAELALVKERGRFVLVNGLAPEEQMAIADWRAGAAG